MTKIAEEIRRAFALASMRRVARDIATPTQWSRAGDIQSKARKLRYDEERLFHLRYDTRVETAMKRLIADGGTRRRDLKPSGAASDRFDKASLLLQAQREVRAAHDRRLMTIDRGEMRLLSKLMEESRRENAMSVRMHDAFLRSADRRIGPDRRRTGPTMQ